MHIATNTLRLLVDDALEKALIGFSHRTYTLAELTHCTTTHALTTTFGLAHTVTLDIDSTAVTSVARIAHDGLRAPPHVVVVPVPLAVADQHELFTLGKHGVRDTPTVTHASNVIPDAVSDKRRTQTLVFIGMQCGGASIMGNPLLAGRIAAIAVPVAPLDANVERLPRRPVPINVDARVPKRPPGRACSGSGQNGTGWCGLSWTGPTDRTTSLSRRGNWPRRKWWTIRGTRQRSRHWNTSPIGLDRLGLATNERREIDNEPPVR